MAIKNISNKRTAGILMHISSLPSIFGIGDMGPEAYKMVDFLRQSHQHYWQLLPLNPVESGVSPSPYSSVSSMAGNILFISPELLVKEGLLTEQDIQTHILVPTSFADYPHAEKSRAILLDKAYEKFKQLSAEQKEDYTKFCQEEAEWLDSFALYMDLKKSHHNASWIHWPDPYKHRNEKALQRYYHEHKDRIDFIKWQQYIFDKQWKALKTYGNTSGVKFFGDLSFYVSHDSADVWYQQEIFNLDKNGEVIGVAGVPPDYFNENGQLWGMPVYKWDVLKEQQYNWWVKRIKRNIELFDVVRLDHFLAFVNYYEIPGDHHNAKEGKWKQGPGRDLFNTLEKELGHLPFIAEDLGEVSAEVFQLRDEFHFPGMKILQFAFGMDMPTSVHTPHNYHKNCIVYTGTHDNNTTIGWLKENTGKTEAKNLKLYTGLKANEKNIHNLLAKLAYSSVANTVILPIQDVLGLGSVARMNTPGTVDNNWTWRLLPNQLGTTEKRKLKNWTKSYNRL